VTNRPDRKVAVRFVDSAFNPFEISFCVSEKVMPSDLDSDLPIGQPIANGWANFSETVLPTIAGTDRAQARIAFHFGAMYVLQIVEQLVALESPEEAALGLRTLDAELDEFMKAHAVAIQ
jgi:hypothetical protein